MVRAGVIMGDSSEVHSGASGTGPDRSSAARPIARLAQLTSSCKRQ